MEIGQLKNTLRKQAMANLYFLKYILEIFRQWMFEEIFLLLKQVSR